MIRFLRIKIFSYAGHLPMHSYAPFMIVRIMCGASWSIYEGVYTFERTLAKGRRLKDLRGIHLLYIDGSIIYELIIIFFSFKMEETSQPSIDAFLLCIIMERLRASTYVNLLTNKASLSKRKSAFLLHALCGSFLGASRRTILRQTSWTRS
jgi:hypothetical protein